MVPVSEPEASETLSHHKGIREDMGRLSVMLMVKLEGWRRN
jgi:hypothetical protein